MRQTFWVRCLFLILLWSGSSSALATQYTFSYWSNTNELPTCSGGSWSRSGSTFTCSGTMILADGDEVYVSTAWYEYLDDIVIVAVNGFELNNNIIGTSSKTITLQSGYGTVTANGTNTVVGDITTASGGITLNNTTLTGSITTSSTLTMTGGSVSGDISAGNGIDLSGTSVTGSLTSGNGPVTMSNGSVGGDISAGNSLTLTDVTVDGSITANNGTISLTGGTIYGGVNSSCCAITADGTDLLGGAISGSNSLTISNGTLQGDFYAGGNPATFDNVIMTSGTVTAGEATFTGSTLGTPSDPVTVDTQWGEITLNDTLVYGDLTTPDYSTVVVNGSSVVIGTCTPGSTPAEACSGNQPLTCLTDDFSRAALGEDWIATRLSGNFTPSISSQRLLLTQDTTYQSTATTLQRLFPADGNLIEVEFDHYAWSSSWTGADGITLVFSDATITPQAGSFGGSLGYAQRDNGDDGFAGGWLGIALDEYGNFSNPTEGRIGGPGFEENSVTIRGSGSGQSGYRYITGKFNLNPAIDYRSNNQARPGYRYRITIDARSGTAAYVTVERKTNNNYVVLIDAVDVMNAAGQAAIPDNLLLSLTGSTGASSNNHAIDNLQICARTINPIGPVVHHFEFSYGSDALTCSPQEVFVKACANASCSELYTGDVELTLNPSGWEGGDTQIISAGSGTLDLWHTSAGTVNISVATSSPVSQAYTTNLCSVDGGALSADCSLTFADAGFVLDIPDITAGQGTDGALLKAVKKSDTSTACVPAFADVTRTVNLWSTYIDPDDSGRVVSWPVRINGTTDAGSSSATAQAVALAFNSNGEATFSVNYADAGRMQLNALYSGSGDDDGLLLENISTLAGNGQFNSIPAGFCVQTGGECAAADSSCDVFKKAGETFPLTVQAVGWQMDSDSDLCDGNTPTPSFSMSGMQFASELVSPSAGVNGSVTPATFDQAAASDNLNTITATEAEVGVFRFTVTPATTYLGHTIPAGASEPAGRFIPAYFTAGIISAGELQPFCTSGDNFMYTGQDSSWLSIPVLQITAKNTAAATTQNYTQPGYLMLPATAVDISLPASDSSAVGTDSNLLALSGSLLNGSLAVSNPGVMTYSLSSQDSLRYDKTLLSRIAPFTPDISLTLNSASDTDNVNLLSTLSFTPIADFTVRYGRLWLDNAYGPETLDLGMNLHTEYFNGSRFVLNSSDSCWQYDAPAAVTLSSASLTQVTGNSGDLVAGSGDNAVLLQAPVNVAGTPDTGDVTVEYAVPLWLQDDFDSDGEFESPAATATFGIYRGHDRIIYWREVY